jgi:tetraprenyl-beta-curcumene synthase
MSEQRRSRIPSRRDTAAILGGFARYCLAIVPAARHELRHWEQRARTIPDPILRRSALAKLRDEHLNAEAAAVFSALVPVARIPDVVRATVAFQVTLDYLDTLTEQPVEDPLRNGLQLHRALTAAATPYTQTVDWYRYHPQSDDGGYLDALVATCRTALGALPSTPAVLPIALRAAARCGEAQTRAHTVATGGIAQLRAWSMTQHARVRFAWWELAAGGASSVAVHALFAAAADPRTTRRIATSIEAAYFPWICALNTLLDSLIDYSHDVSAMEHSYLAYYPTPDLAALRLGEIAARAVAAARLLPNGPTHASLVAGIAGFYLSAPEAASRFARPIATSVVHGLGPLYPPVLAVMRLRRLVNGGTRPDEPVESLASGLERDG